MKTKEERLNKIASDGFWKLYPLVYKQIITAMERYAVEYHESKVKNLSLSDVSECDGNSARATLIAFKTFLAERYEFAIANKMVDEYLRYKEINGR